MNTKVLSVRLPVSVVAQCYDIIEALEMDPSKVGMGSAVTLTLRALLQALENRGELHTYSEGEAENRLGQGKASMPKLSACVEFKPTPSLPGRIMHKSIPPEAIDPVEDVSEEEAVATLARRERLAELLGKKAEAIEEETEQHLFETMHVGVIDRVSPDEKPEPEEQLLPPWHVTPLARPEAMSPYWQGVWTKEQDLLKRKAIQAVYAQFKMDTTMKLINDTYTLFKKWEGEHETK